MHILCEYGETYLDSFWSYHANREMSEWTAGWMDGWTDGWTDGEQTDRQTDDDNTPLTWKAEGKNSLTILSIPLISYVSNESLEPKTGIHVHLDTQIKCWKFITACSAILSVIHNQPNIEKHSCFWAALFCGWTGVKIPLNLAGKPDRASSGAWYLVPETPTWYFNDDLSNLPSLLFMVMLWLLMCCLSWRHFILYYFKHIFIMLSWNTGSLMKDASDVLTGDKSLQRVTMSSS